MEQYVALDGGGQLTIRDEGLRLRIRATAALPQIGLYKVWIYGRGEPVLLGTMTPEGKQLVVERVFTRQTLRQQHCEPIQGGWVQLFHKFAKQQPFQTMRGWQGICQDRLIQQGLEQHWKCLLEKREGNIIWVAAPFSPQREIPLLPLICLAQVKQMGQQRYLIWKFAEGKPVLPDEYENKQG